MPANRCSAPGPSARQSGNLSLYNRAMSPARPLPARLTLIAAVAAVLLPALIFYAILLRRAVNLPFVDDYDALLQFLNSGAQVHGLFAKAAWFFSAQHNEYKLFFEEGIVWLQLALFGHVNFLWLCALGNSFIAVLALQLWQLFLPHRGDLPTRLLLFLPVSWLLFQLQYVETVDSAMASLQNLPVLVFSLGAFMLLPRASLRSFCGALVCMALAIASSGNGVFVLPVGLLVLLLHRRFLRILPWLVVSALCLAAYAWHYNVLSSQSPHTRSVFATLLHLRVGYILAFMGSAFGHPQRFAPFLRAAITGAALTLWFALAALRGYFNRRPVVATFLLFLLITSVGVAGLRSDFGVQQSLVSRYAIYSALLLILAWFIFAEDVVLPRLGSRPGQQLLAGFTLASVLFALIMDVLGWRSLVQRDTYLVQGMRACQHGVAQYGVLGPLPPLPNQTIDVVAIDRHAASTLVQSEALHIYRPPAS
jgi:hypothetical protein